MRQRVSFFDIGSYRILQQIGGGATSHVHLARSLDSGETICVKIVNKSRLEKPNELELFLREVSVLSRISHKNIIKYIDFLEDSDRYFLFIEYCNGKSLQSLIFRSNRISEEHSKRIMKQLLSALDYLHTNGISHRDIKPENIIVDSEYRLKLIDFGLTTENAGNLSTTYCGSPIYAAPECLSEQPYIPYFADIWSAGLILYVMAVGSLPWKNSNVNHLIKTIISTTVSIPDFVPSGCSSLISKMLKNNPTDRQQASKLLQHSWLGIPNELVQSNSKPVFFSQNRSNSPRSPIILVKKKPNPEFPVSPPPQIKASNPRTIIQKHLSNDIQPIKKHITI